MCAVLDISQRTYYKYRNKEDKDCYDYLIIKEIFDESKSTCGYRRVCEGLKIKYGVIFNYKKVQRIMNKCNLKPEYIKRIRPNFSCKRIEANVKSNIVNRQFQKEKMYQDLSFTVIKDSNIHLLSTKPFANLME